MDDRMRLLGVTTEKIAAGPDGLSPRVTGLYGALGRRYDLVGFARPSLGKADKYLSKLRHFHPDRETWTSRSGLSPWVFQRRTTLVEPQIAARDGEYDLIVQLHTLCAPGTRFRERPYVLHTDNTYTLSERYYRPWGPLTGREREQRIALEGDVFRNAAFLFPRSEWLRRSMIDDYGCDPERVVRVGGGANFVADSIDGKRYDGKIALFVGEGFRRKGGSVLLEAWQRVRSELPDAQLWIVGPKAEGELAEERPGVKVFGYVQGREALEDLFRQASAFVLPSLFEPWGHAYYEAMGQGLACIGTNQGATPEIIAHGRTGLLVPPGEPVPLADALLALLGRPELAERFGKQAYTELQHGHTWDDVIGRMAPYLEQAASVRA